ncbi:hypothetical protein [Streptomyces sp. NPDC059788]|uniref:hypothetical protein n=1 Tax=Streptomyces sp. NPDC059788 TaxID=3346948 RepID=UPI00364E9AE3
MGRSPGTTGRRRNLQDAANGIFPSRVHVVLYACIDDEHAADAVMAALRAYATARDWVVVEKYYDLSTAEARLGLSHAVDIVRSGKAHGVVAPNTTHLTGSRFGQGSLADLLQVIDGAFVDYLTKVPTAPVTPGAAS